MEYDLVKCGCEVTESKHEYFSISPPLRVLHILRVMFGAGCRNFSVIFRELTGAVQLFF